MSHQATLQDLLAQQKALDEKIELARRAERDSAIAKTKELITSFGLTAAEVFPSNSRKPKTSKKTVEPKYKDPATGATWTGRGKAPVWIAGRDRAPFSIQ